MLLSEEHYNQSYQIKAYTPGEITINDTKYTDSLIVSANHLISPWHPNSLNELADNDWQAILELQPEIVLLGTGLKFIMPPDKQLAPLHQQQIGVECMDTAAACRTFMALLAEDRKVAAALLIK